MAKATRSLALSDKVDMDSERLARRMDRVAVGANNNGNLVDVAIEYVVAEFRDTDEVQGKDNQKKLDRDMQE